MRNEITAPPLNLPAHGCCVHWSPPPPGPPPAGARRRSGRGWGPPAAAAGSSLLLSVWWYLLSAGCWSQLPLMGCRVNRLLFLIRRVQILGPRSQNTRQRIVAQVSISETGDRASSFQLELFLRSISCLKLGTCHDSSNIDILTTFVMTMTAQ